MRKALHSLCATLATAGTVLVPTPAHAVGLSLASASPPPSDQVAVDLVTANGSGCPGATATATMSPDNTAITVRGGALNYTALVGVGATPTDWRKNCQLNLSVNVPTGFTYAITSADYRGFASLATGAAAIVRANYYFQGQSQTAYGRHNFTGPLDDEWQITDWIPLAAMIYAPCGGQRNLNVNTELRAMAGTSDVKNSTSYISMEDGSDAMAILHLGWATCPSDTR